MVEEALMGLLRQGVHVWNDWRNQHLEVAHPDLTKCDLSGLSLSGADFSGANLNFARLSGTDLKNANLRKANLSYADISQANLYKADLSGAIIMYASFTSADLSYANLSYTSLVETDFVEAKLHCTNLQDANLTGSALFGTLFLEAEVSGVDFTDTMMCQTVLASIDFSKAGGFHSVIHRGPSHISVDTLMTSRAVLPDVFLRGLGIPENFIQSLQALPTSMKNLPWAYVIHSQWERNIAMRLHTDLQHFGMRCWLFEYSVDSQGNWLQSVDDTYVLKTMLQDDRFILLCTKRVLESPWLRPFLLTVQQREAKVGHTLLVLCQMDNALVEMDTPEVVALRSTYPVVDFTQWQKKEAYEESILQLLIVLQAQSSI
jgi:hypothetical protein